MPSEPERKCARCGERRRLFLIDPDTDTWVCKWQSGCDHRVMTRQARHEAVLRGMWEQVQDFLRID